MGQLGVRVPDDVAIAGFDDYTVSQYIHGGITSIKAVSLQNGRSVCEYGHQHD